MPDLTIDVGEEALMCQLGDALGRMLQAGDAVLLDGPLGAGKTTLARAALRAACHQPGLEVPSPTYTLSQEYESPMGPLTHLDLWRVDGPEALTELDWFGARQGVVIVEWPDRLGALRPPDALAISLSVSEHARSAALRGWPSERLERLRRLIEEGRA